MSKKGLSSILIAFFIFLLFICSCCGFVILVAAAVEAASPADNITIKTLQDESTDNVIAVIDIKGVIASDASNSTDNPDMVDMILRKLKKAENDEAVKAIILRLDTPGGTVYDSDKIAKEIKRIDQEKPIITLMESSATSGGYFISAPTRKIIASETTLTGSIGVIVQVVELDGLYDKLGIKVITLTNTQGDVKTMQNLDDPNSKDRNVMEQVLDDNFEEFIKVIMEGRGMKRADVLKIADGSIFSGTKAKELGLVDELGDFDTAVETAKEEAGIDKADILVYDTYIDPWNSLELFMENNINPLSSFSRKLNKEPGNYAYYLPE